MKSPICAGQLDIYCSCLAGLAGVAITYCLSLSSALGRFLWNLSALEVTVVCAERILQYSALPSEAPLVIESARPARNWPSKGTIEIHNLQASTPIPDPVINTFRLFRNFQILMDIHCMGAIAGKIQRAFTTGVAWLDLHIPRWGEGGYRGSHGQRQIHPHPRLVPSGGACGWTHRHRWARRLHNR